jgi:hypothetical protein
VHRWIPARGEDQSDHHGKEAFFSWAVCWAKAVVFGVEEDKRCAFAGAEKSVKCFQGHVKRWEEKLEGGQEEERFFPGGLLGEGGGFRGRGGQAARVCSARSAGCRIPAEGGHLRKRIHIFFAAVVGRLWLSGQAAAWPATSVAYRIGAKH